MTASLALFPLGLVVFPGETLNLHIFEPRYRQLIADCVSQGMTFGIPAYFDEKLQEYGTEVALAEIINRYPDGRMDITTHGIRAFKMVTFENPLGGGKLYAGGDVSYFEEEDDDTVYAERMLLANAANQIFELMEVNQQADPSDTFLSYTLAHHVGLTLQQEYYVLTLRSERQRQTFLIDHLTRTIPVLTEVEKARRRIRMNGHFKQQNPLDF
jgi:Lon protease-like protein